MCESTEGSFGDSDTLGGHGEFPINSGPGFGALPAEEHPNTRVGWVPALPARDRGIDMSLKQKLNHGDLVLSTMVNEMRTASLPAMLAAGGLDSFIIDMEHGTHDWSDMAAMIGVGRGVGLLPVVRIPEIRRETVMKPLDAGAAGILVPMVSTPEDARQIVEWAKYPSEGLRGVALRRGHNDFRAVQIAPYLLQANADTTVIIQIETVEALERVDELVAVPGVDCVFIGPNDLSVALEVPGQLDCDLMRSACDRVLHSAAAAGVAVGYQSVDLGQAKDLIQRGVRYLSYSSEVNAIIDQATEASSSLRIEAVNS